ncbi:hypothetical protein K435DRAFT_858445 [Dendrothele bispora CBS 962.96]|uniref:Uncharacterized protein n=1 Tax=Dendrothele bispora (strain CBS 962.96) TaxID=1314807 RepID=A0A4S8M363_DENBC|nr:hypothetical protein K435DRAFT_858445 [Dendrothele bispora CBS 962.96]
MRCECPLKQFKVSHFNVSSNLKTFSSLGLQYHEDSDDVIHTQHVSKDRQRCHTSVTTARYPRERTFTSIQPQRDWDNFSDAFWQQHRSGQHNTADAVIHF